MRSAPTTADPGLLGLFEASAQNVEDTARLLHALLADYPEHAGLATDILRCEHDGDGIDPMTVIRWKAIFETLEAAVDDCERVADVLEAIVLKAGRRARVLRQRL